MAAKAAKNGVITKQVIRKYRVCRGMIGNRDQGGPFLRDALVTAEHFGEHAEQIDRLVELGALEVVEVDVTDEEASE